MEDVNINMIAYGLHKLLFIKESRRESVASSLLHPITKHFNYVTGATALCVYLEFLRLTSRPASRYSIP